jgi:hypothetical protein
MVIEVGPEVGHGWRGSHPLESVLVVPFAYLGERPVNARVDGPLANAALAIVVELGGRPILAMGLEGGCERLLARHPFAEHYRIVAINRTLVHYFVGGHSLHDVSQGLELPPIAWCNLHLGLTRLSALGPTVIAAATSPVLLIAAIIAAGTLPILAIIAAATSPVLLIAAIIAAGTLPILAIVAAGTLPASVIAVAVATVPAIIAVTGPGAPASVAVIAARLIEAISTAAVSTTTGSTTAVSAAAVSAAAVSTATLKIARHCGNGISRGNKTRDKREGIRSRNFV